MHKRILFAIMLITSFLSLWLPNNEAAAIMMLPITILIVKEFVKLDNSMSALNLIEANSKNLAAELKISTDCHCKQ
jgi:di/tricarboxylate transporter